MSVTEWRRKHPKCKYCRHLEYMSLPPFCVGRDTWCAAKMAIVNENIPRLFCKVYETEAEA